jgi:PAS domain S-box-containing protein
MNDKTEDKKKILKNLITEMRSGGSTNNIKEQVKEIFNGLSSFEIVKIEQDLIKEGLQEEDIKSLCDVHLSQMSLNENSLAPPGHTVNTLMEEHKILLSFANELNDLSSKLTEDDYDSNGDIMKTIKHVENHLRESEKHYLREENVLFPHIENHGITGPPAMMWSEHNLIRAKKKEFYELLANKEKNEFEVFKKIIIDISNEIFELLSTHFPKENNILFPAAMRVISEDEWTKIRNECDEIGYCSYSPKSAKPQPIKEEEPKERPKISTESIIFKTGDVSLDQLETFLNILPLDLTFVDHNNEVKYFNQPKDKIFLRTKSIIGRKVQACHPPESIDIVNEIVESFRTGAKDSAEFWINMGERLIHIRFFAARSKKGEYLGALELVQDITDLKKIEGERRLLNWK